MPAELYSGVYLDLGEVTQNTLPRVPLVALVALEGHRPPHLQLDRARLEQIGTSNIRTSAPSVVSFTERGGGELDKLLKDCSFQSL